MPDFDQTAVFLLQQIKQFLYGYEALYQNADEWGDGSPAKGFHMVGLYNHLAAFYLLDQGDRPMGGAFFKALKIHGRESLLEPIREVVASSLGQTTFGEVVRVFRNKAVVHASYSDADLDRIYSKVDMEDPVMQERFFALLSPAYVETRTLAIEIVKATGRPPSDFGMRSV